VNDLDLVARGDAMLGVSRAGHDGTVDLDGNRTLGEAKVLDELPHRDAGRDLPPGAVDHDLHGGDATIAAARRQIDPFAGLLALAGQFQEGSLLEPQDALQLELSVSTRPGFWPLYCQQ
jgi:hypothetical protein